MILHFWKSVMMHGISSIVIFQKRSSLKKQLSNYQHYINKKRILALYNYAQAKSKDHLQLYDHAISLTKLHVSPLFIFEGLLKFCHEKRLIKPGYTTMQSLISKAEVAPIIRTVNVFIVIERKRMTINE